MADLKGMTVGTGLGGAMLELPADVVKQSVGFSLDIGGSNVKVVYRSNEEYKNGNPVSDKHATIGVLHTELFPMRLLEDAIALINQKCDVTRDADGTALVFTTGLGANFNKAKLEEKLKIKLTNISEMDLFSEAFAFLSRDGDQERLFEPLSQKALASGAELMQASIGWSRFLGRGHIATDADYSLRGDWFPCLLCLSGSGNALLKYIDTEADYSLRGDWFPCLLVICGSGNPILKVERDGRYQIVDFPLLGGRFLQGFSAICCGAKTYEEMEALIAGSDGRSVDVYVSDAVTSPKESDVDAYNAIAGDEYDIRLLPFGKGTENPEAAKKGDVLYSMQRNVADTLARAVFHSSFRANTRNIFFVGNFVSIPRVVDWMTEMLHYQNLRIPPEERINFRFVRGGGFHAALGGYMRQRHL